MLWVHTMTFAVAAEIACDARQDSSRSLLQTSQSKFASAGAEHDRVCVEAYADGLDQVYPQMGTLIRTHPLRASVVSARAMIFNAGMGGTGTRSISLALNLLNFTGCHFTSDWGYNLIYNVLGMDSAWNISSTVPRVQRTSNNMTVPQALACTNTLRSMDLTAGLASDIEYLADTPVPMLFIDLYLAFPNAKWLLSTRSAHEWAPRERMRGNWSGVLPPVQEPCGSTVGDFSDDANAKFLELQEQLVRCMVPSTRLFEISLMRKTASEKKTILRRMAAFLGRNLTRDAEFPHIKGYDGYNVSATSCFSMYNVTNST